MLNPARAPIPLPLDAPADGARPEPLDDLKTALSWLRGEREALLAAVRQAKDEGLDAQAWQLSWALDTFLNEQGRWDDEGAAWAVALEAATALTDGPALAYAYSFLAVTYCGDLNASGHAKSRYCSVTWGKNIYDGSYWQIASMQIVDSMTDGYCAHGTFSNGGSLVDFQECNGNWYSRTQRFNGSTLRIAIGVKAGPWSDYTTLDAPSGYHN